MFVSFDFRIGLGHEANVKTLFDFEEILVSPMLSFWNIMNASGDRA